MSHSRTSPSQSPVTALPRLLSSPTAQILWSGAAITAPELATVEALGIRPHTSLLPLSPAPPPCAPPLPFLPSGLAEGALSTPPRLPSAQPHRMVCHARSRLARCENVCAFTPSAGLLSFSDTAPQPQRSCQCLSQSSARSADLTVVIRLLLAVLKMPAEEAGSMLRMRLRNRSAAMDSRKLRVFAHAGAALSLPALSVAAGPSISSKDAESSTTSPCLCFMQSNCSAMKTLATGATWVARTEARGKRRSRETL
eukprot:302334-Rhodomonas_salina.1